MASSRRSASRAPSDPIPADDWTQGWTYYDSTGAHRTGPAPSRHAEPARSRSTPTSTSTRSQTWSADSNYYVVEASLRIKDQASLTIPAGTVIFEERRRSLGVLIVDRGGKIFAIGTAIGADHHHLRPAAGLHGCAVRAAASTCWAVRKSTSSTPVPATRPPRKAANPRIPPARVSAITAAPTTTDNSGTLKYVRVEYAGNEITPNNELNSFTFCGVRQRHARSITSKPSSASTITSSGSAAPCDSKHLIGIDGNDDGYDSQLGSPRPRAIHHHAVSRRSSRRRTTRTATRASRRTTTSTTSRKSSAAGRSNPTVSNCTFIGDHRSGDPILYPQISSGPTSAVNLRNGTAGTVINAIGVRLQAGRPQDRRRRNLARSLCRISARAPAQFCPSTTVVDQSARLRATCSSCAVRRIRSAARSTSTSRSRGPPTFMSRSTPRPVSAWPPSPPARWALVSTP